mmetsp:Transcript_28652/g.52152  ORF Transcript_28652/g.52152 Transcript_28652/m.52152 type:complete len:223 (+) Transcript_28652:22-690(+)
MGAVPNCQAEPGYLSDTAGCRCEPPVDPAIQQAEANAELMRAAGLGDINAIIEALAGGADLEVRPQPGFKLPRIVMDKEEEVLDFRDGSIFRPSFSGMLQPYSPEHDCCSSGGLTPLMWAALHGQAMACALLVDASAQLEVADRGGRQALHYAAQNGCYETCRALLSARASPQARDAAGRDPFDCLPPRCIFLPKDIDEWQELLRKPLPRPKAPKQLKLANL